MASLTPGVLVKLLQNLESADESVPGVYRPALLQVTGIFPILTGSNLWPIQGFYLKVSDSLHTMYVSVPREYDEMILSDKLQLGQFIYAQRLESALPVPLLKGLKPIPGRHPCSGSQDLVAATNSLGFLQPPSDLRWSAEKNNRGVRERLRKTRSLSASKISGRDQNSQWDLSFWSVPSSPVDFFYKKQDIERTSSSVLKEISTISVACVDEDNNFNSSKSSYFSRPKAARRKWDGNGAVKAKLKDRLDSQGSFQHHNKDKRTTLARSQSVGLPPFQFVLKESYVYKDDNSNCLVTRKSENEPALEVVPHSIKRKLVDTNSTCGESTCRTVPVSPASRLRNDRKSTANITLWSSLPPNLVKLGKEVLRHRDAALLAAVDALHEAAAAERSIRCLSVYAELLPSKEKDPQPIIDRFLKFHDDMAQTRAIMQSLAKISPLRMPDSDGISLGSIKEALKVTVERKKRAASWIKAAMACDLSPIPATVKAIAGTAESGATRRNLGTLNYWSKESSMLSSNQNQQKHGDNQIYPAAGKSNLQWIKGNVSLVAADLANELQDECKRWFLGYVEKFLDDVESEAMYSSTDSQIARLLCQIKRIDGWLRVIASKDGRSLLWEDELKACMRVRKKIYGILLKHVECAANALENPSITYSVDL